jgi:anti-sigma regulatory factor (Ser/Thr protein kinase)
MESQESKKTTPASMRLEFMPSTLLISVVRKFVSEFYERLISDADAVSRVALATHELLENTVKYSTDGHASIAIDVEERDGREIVRIRTRNPTSPEHIAEAVKLVSALRSADDRFEFYQLQMQRTARRPDGSGLGLVRVCVEGEMDLRWCIEGSLFEILAETDIRKLP